MTCRICQDREALDREAGGVCHVQCRRCGEFSTTTEAAEDWHDGYWDGLNTRQRANVSGWIREHQGIQIDTGLLQTLPLIPTPSVSERANKLLLEMEKRAETAGQLIRVHDSEGAALDFGGAAWAVNQGELKYLARDVLAQSREFIHQSAQGAYTITAGGYDYLEKLRRTNADSQIGFAAMWFNPETDAAWANGIEPAIAAAGYNPKRIDRHEHNNRIDDEIIAMIRKSRFVIADYTGNRGGVYFEAGYGMGLSLPVIWTCRMDAIEQLHFDVRQYSFIFWSPDKLKDFRGRVQNRIEATIGRGSYVARG